MKITLSNLFEFYKYPCQEIKDNVVPVPYIKKENVVCDHPASLTYKEWKAYMLIYLKYFKLYLLSGLDVKLPYRMGNIQMFKVRGGGADYSKDKLSFHKNAHTDGYRPFFKWNKKHLVVPEKSMWACRPTKGPKGEWKRISKKIFADPSLIYKFKTLH